MQKIYFVGWLGFSTQIDTETRTLLAWDIVNLPKGTPLQTRQDYFGRRVCVADTKRSRGVGRPRAGRDLGLVEIMGGVSLPLLIQADKHELPIHLFGQPVSMLFLHALAQRPEQKGSCSVHRQRHTFFSGPANLFDILGIELSFGQDGGELSLIHDKHGKKT